MVLKKKNYKTIVTNRDFKDFLKLQLLRVCLIVILRSISDISNI